MWWIPPVPAHPADVPVPQHRHGARDCGHALPGAGLALNGTGTGTGTGRAAPTPAATPPRDPPAHGSVPSHLRTEPPYPQPPRAAPASPHPAVLPSSHPPGQPLVPGVCDPPKRRGAPFTEGSVPSHLGMDPPYPGHSTTAPNSAAFSITWELCDCPIPAGAPLSRGFCDHPKLHGVPLILGCLRPVQVRWGPR